jgi:hypothetical protein
LNQDIDDVDRSASIVGNPDFLIVVVGKLLLVDVLLVVIGWSRHGGHVEESCLPGYLD